MAKQIDTDKIQALTTDINNISWVCTPTVEEVHHLRKLKEAIQGYEDFLNPPNK